MRRHAELRVRNLVKKGAGERGVLWGRVDEVARLVELVGLVEVDGLVEVE